MTSADLFVFIMILYLRLFLAHIDIDGGAVEIPCLAYLVLKITAIGFLDPLGKVAEEYECGYRRTLEHGDVFDFDKLALVGGGRVGTDCLEHDGVELRCGDDALAVLAYVERCLEHLEYTLLGEG